VHRRKIVLGNARADGYIRLALLQVLVNSMKRNPIRLAILAVLLIAATAFAPVPEAELNFTLVNSTGVTIDKLLVAGHGSNTWGKDILGKDQLANGQSVKIVFHPTEENDLWDIRVEDTTGKYIVWEAGFDLSKIEKITLKYDGKTGKGTAFYE
jgi:hypothetical protein